MKRFFDLHAWYLLIPLCAAMLLDLFLTLVSQSESYWRHFLNSFEAYPYPEYVNEAAFWGAGQLVLATHPLLFIGLFSVYIGIVCVVVMSKKLNRVRLSIYWMIFIIHITFASSWLRDYIPWGWLWSYNILYFSASGIIAALFQEKYLKSRCYF